MTQIEIPQPIDITAAPAAQHETGTHAWMQPVTIPTYTLSKPTSHPMFFRKRAYQGSSGVVYPLPLYEHIRDEKISLDHNAVFIENESIKVMILPDLGGRIHMAYDKRRDYHFVYFNRVIKPALVGLNGPWISGGIEFNWPQHHRPTTYSSVEFQLFSEGERAGVRLSDIDPLYGTSVTTVIELHSRDVRIHISARFSNRTALDQSFLWWANPAVGVNDEYQAVFPRDVHTVLDHGKRDKSDFPIATGVYYKVDYSPGTDISWYRNVPVPTSYMAQTSFYDFVGGYDHQRSAGIMHSASCLISPGKKMWTWGRGDFAQAWQRNLTDSDGPYVELMTGAFSDNQPDFTWLTPGEHRSFYQTFFPYHALSTVIVANKNGIIGFTKQEIFSFFSPTDQTVQFSWSYRNLQDTETRGQSSFLKVTAGDVVECGCNDQLCTPNSIEYVVVTSMTNEVLLSYNRRSNEEVQSTSVAEAPLSPNEVTSVEQLYLIGTHIEQYRLPSRGAEDYYAEALRRDQGFSPALCALAQIRINQARFGEAVEYARRACSRLQEWNGNPRTGKAHYLLGLALRLEGNRNEARNSLGKALWAADTTISAAYELASLAARERQYQDAWNLILGESAFAQDTSDPLPERSANLLLTLARKLNKPITTMFCDVLYQDCETVICNGESTEPSCLARIAQHPQRVREVLGELYWNGFATDALALISTLSDGHMPVDRVSYILVAAAILESDDERTSIAGELIRRAEESLIENLFPNRLVEGIALRRCLGSFPDALRAKNLLGMYEYSLNNNAAAEREWSEIITAFERPTTVYPPLKPPEKAGVLRNFALLLGCCDKDLARAQDYLSQAVALAPDDGRLLSELDELNVLLGESLEARHTRFAQRPTIVSTRDDLVRRNASVLTSLDRPEEALDQILSHRFHPWEGGEGLATREYRRARIRIGIAAVLRGSYEAGLESFEQARTNPDSLGEGVLAIENNEELDYWSAICLKHMGQDEQAQRLFQRASKGNTEPAMALYYNDTPARAVVYVGLALSQHNQKEQSTAVFEGLLTHADAFENTHLEADFFAVSYPEMVAFSRDLVATQREFCNLIRGYGYFGLGDMAAASSAFSQVLEENPSQEDAADHLWLVQQWPTLPH